jgi:putative ABC transport system permease protein
MWSFAFGNLRSRPARTALGLVGLAIGVVGVLGLYSLSGGLRTLVADTLSQIPGVMVVRENTPIPVFSDLPAALGDRLRQIPGVAAVAPELWKIAPPIEGRSLIQNLSRGLGQRSDRIKGLWNVNVVLGEDIAAHHCLKHPVGPAALLPPEQGGGRYLDLSDRGQPHVVISKKIAEDYRDAAGRPKRVGDTLQLGTRPFTIVGIYETKSVLLDVILVMDINTARDLLGAPKDAVSCFYVEANEPTRIDAVTRRIEAMDTTVDARSVAEFQAPYGLVLDQVDELLWMTVSLAVIVGVIGIVNTMLMATSERFVEFGVLRANGWSPRQVLALVLSEGIGLGLLAGVLGSALALAGVALANRFTGGGLHLVLNPQLLGAGLAMALATGALGGLYPAWQASRLVPMDAIRRGAH